ncbi:MAG TPA: cytochrome-c peroxidase, partial [Novosphingobium sp.]|nr:cytochrome-c peroxidase [Novosphingobium sp.]
MAALLPVLAPAAAGQTPAKARIELGRRLFYDADLSRDGTMACATCHEQRHGFADGNRTHPGVTDEPGRRNVPGLANVGRFTRLTWADP